MRLIPMMVPLVLATAACVAWREPPVATPERPPEPRCGASHDADFEGGGQAQLRGYLAWLARTYGGAAALAPREVSLAVVRGQAKPGPAGVTAAEISCDAGGYRITLYRNALSGRPQTVVWQIVAHEFHHIVQVRRDGLACEAPPGQRARYEQEAAAFAAKAVPKCR